MFKQVINVCLLSLVISGCSFQDKSQNISKQDNADKPNIVMILTDDQGYGDLGFYNNQHLETPSIDDLFNEGVRLERFHVSPVCSPTRASLLTGRSPLTTGIFHVTRGGEKMPVEEKTIAEYLKPAGYTNGLFGKWHNGLQYPYNPLGQGFDEFYGFADGHKTLYFDNEIQHNKKTVPFEGYIADRLADKTIEFIEQNQNNPFFALLSFNTPHGPFEVPEPYFNKYKAKGLSDLDASIYGMVDNIDDNVDRVLQKLEQLKLTDNTIVIYLSDNGPAFPHGTSRYNAGLKGHKGKVDEGGVRSPFVIKWPAQLPTNKSVEQIAQHIDLLPTLLSLLDIEADEKAIEGVDLSPLLQGDTQDWPDRLIYTHRFQIGKHTSRDPIHLGPGAVRSQRWLATVNEAKKWALYDLKNDPYQHNDLSQANPAKLFQLKKAYTDWYESKTYQHGAYQTLPIHLGHTGYEQTQLPAHEALIENDNLTYQFEYGWSHDWLTSTASRSGKAVWPVKIINDGQYDIYLGYSTPEQAYAGGLGLQLGAESFYTANIPAYVASKKDAKRYYHTDEAPELNWGEMKLGQFNLTKDMKHLAVNFANDAEGRPLWVKYIRVVKR